MMIDDTRPMFFDPECAGQLKLFLFIMVNEFSTNKALLNPKFEGYKLELIPQENAVFRFKLDHKSTQATASGKAPLSFQEMQSRITHNHLYVSDSGLAIYIDENYNVCLVCLLLSGVSCSSLLSKVYTIVEGIEVGYYDTVFSSYLSIAYSYRLFFGLLLKCTA
jgi:hypothetical protein